MTPAEKMAKRKAAHKAVRKADLLSLVFLMDYMICEKLKIEYGLI
jgi:hypothetical protein